MSTTTVVQRAMPRETDSYEDGAVLAQQFKDAGCTRLILTARLYTTPDQLSLVHELLNDPAIRPVLVERYRNPEPLTDLPQIDKPLIVSTALQCLQDQTGLPHYPWAKLAQPNSWLCRSFAGPSRASHTGLSAAAHLLKQFPGYAGLIANWRGPIQLAGFFVYDDPCYGALEAYYSLKDSLRLVPGALHPGADQLLTLARAACQLNMAGTLLVYERLMETLRHMEPGDPIGIAVHPTVSLYDSYSIEVLEEWGYSLDPVDPFMRPSSVHYWLAYRTEALYRGGLRALSVLAAAPEYLQAWLLAGFMAYGDDTADDLTTASWLDVLLDRDASAISTLWNDVHAELAHQQKRLYDALDNPTSTTRETCLAIRDEAVANLRQLIAPALGLSTDNDA